MKSNVQSFNFKIFLAIKSKPQQLLEHISKCGENITYVHWQTVFRTISGFLSYSFLNRHVCLQCNCQSSSNSYYQTLVGLSSDLFYNFPVSVLLQSKFKLYCSLLLKLVPDQSSPKSVSVNPFYRCVTAVCDGKYV